TRVQTCALPISQTAEEHEPLRSRDRRDGVHLERAEAADRFEHAASGAVEQLGAHRDPPRFLRRDDAKLHALAMALDEVENAIPGIFGGRGEVLVAAVEEAMRRSLVDDELVLDPGLRERLLEGLVLLGRDVLVVACLQREDRRLDLAGAMRGARLPVALG